jgi:radical SAM protein with 4Fe4S-binding SPASM domain
MGLLNDLGLVPKLLRREWNYRRRHLVGCSLEPTNRCNLRCTMCGVHTLARPGDKDRELTQGEMLSVLDELGRMGVTWLQLIGGEPYLRPDETCAVTRRASEMGVQTTVVTNGTLIDEALAQEIVDARTQRLIFSVDGVGAVHDRVRGVEGAFERTRRGMELVMEERRRRGAKVPVVEIQSTLSRFNYDQVDALLKFKDEIGAAVIVFLYVSEIPATRLDATRLDEEPLCTRRWAPGSDSCLFTAREVAAFREAMKRAPADKQNRILKALNDEAYLQCRFPTRRCYFMRTILIINPFGDAYPCPHIDKYLTGNVRELGVKGVWQNERHRRAIGGLRKGMYPVCSSCCVFAQNLTPGQLARLGLGMRLG